jgi:hypothetical protein
VLCAECERFVHQAQQGQFFKVAHS